MDHEILRVRDLRAGYGKKVVVSGIDLALRRGEVLGLLGANGSGKSTLLRAISGQLRPISGEITIAGVNLRFAPEMAKARLGYAVDGSDLPMNLSGQQYLELVASLRRCDVRAWPCGNVVVSLGLASWLELPIRQYSMGTRAKISIAAALLGGPELLIFDESLNGLDPLAAWEVKRMIMELASSGRHAVIISTHVVEAVPVFCNRALFLADGQLVQAWEKEGLQNASGFPGAFEAEVIQALKAHLSKGGIAA